MHTYAGTLHGFHNYSTPRYNPDAAKLAWERLVALFDEHLRPGPTHAIQDSDG